MTHTVTTADFTTKGDDLYYTGPRVSEFQDDAGLYVVLIGYGAEPAPTWDDCAEWGKGNTPEDAWRWALAAAFGPIDEEFHPLPLTLREDDARQEEDNG